MAKRIPTEAELELKEVKEAIQTLREYCQSRGNCDNCDAAIENWCNLFYANPYEWEVEDE